MEIVVKESIQTYLLRLVFLVDQMNHSNGIEKLVARTHKMSEIKQSESSLIFINFPKFFPEYQQLFESDNKDLQKDFFELINSENL